MYNVERIRKRHSVVDVSKPLNRIGMQPNETMFEKVLHKKKHP